MWLREHLEHVFKYMDKKDKQNKVKKVKKEVVKNKAYCSKFEEGNNGLCKNYMGCKVNIKSCKQECVGGERRENRKNNRSSTTGDI